MDLRPAEAELIAVRSRFCYLFAPRFNPGLRHAIDPRRQLGVPTIFNLAAPLLNPAQPRIQVIGVADATMAPVIAAVLARLGRSGIVVSGNDGLDKASTMAPSELWVVRDGQICEAILHPNQLGIASPTIAELRGGDVGQNVRLARAVLAGDCGPLRDLVLLNTALGLCASTLEPDRVVDQLATAMAAAAAAVDSGAAAATLADAVSVANSVCSRSSS